MIVIDKCTYCTHRRDKKKDGWIPTCDAYPNGQPLDSEFDEKLAGKKVCNPENGIGFEVVEKYAEEVERLFGKTE